MLIIFEWKSVHESTFCKRGRNTISSSVKRFSSIISGIMFTKLQTLDQMPHQGHHKILQLNIGTSNSIEIECNSQCSSSKSCSIIENRVPARYELVTLRMPMNVLSIIYFHECPHRSERSAISPKPWLSAPTIREVARNALISYYAKLLWFSNLKTTDTPLSGTVLDFLRHPITGILEKLLIASQTSAMFQTISFLNHYPVSNACLHANGKGWQSGSPRLAIWGLAPIGEGVLSATHLRVQPILFISVKFISTVQFWIGPHYIPTKTIWYPNLLILRIWLLTIKCC